MEVGNTHEGHWDPWCADQRNAKKEKVMRRKRNAKEEEERSRERPLPETIADRIAARVWQIVPGQGKVPPFPIFPISPTLRRYSIALDRPTPSSASRQQILHFLVLVRWGGDTGNCPGLTLTQPEFQIFSAKVLAPHLGDSILKSQEQGHVCIRGQ